MNITVNVRGLDETIRRLEEYRDRLEERARELCKRLSDIGLEVAQIGFANAVYDGTNDVYVEVEQRDEHTFLVKASGTTVLFIEFGTGVTFQTYHPLRSELGILEPGTYGHHLGILNGGWRYPEENGAGTYGEADPDHPGYIHTYGNPANMPMYNASRDIRGELERVAREVFSS